jgi:hypothetical protein
MKHGRHQHIELRPVLRALAFATGFLVFGGTAAAQIPTPPGNVRLTIVRDNAIDIFWDDNSNNEAAFDVFRKAGSGSYSLLGAVDANRTFFQDRNSGIRPNVEFCYRVAARNGFGSSALSTEACVTIPPRPNPPSNLQLSRENTSSPLVLTWTDNSSNETDFLVYRDTDGSAYVLYDTVAANVTTYSDLVVRTEGDYCYFVSAINEAGESPGTDPTCLNVTNGFPVPPTDLTAQSVSDMAIDLNWSFGFINHTTLFLERSDDGQTTWTDIYQTTEIVEEYSDVGLNPNTEYCYRVRVENSSNVPGYSPVACSQTAFAVPDTPTGVTADGLEGGAIEVTWQAVESASILYRVERMSGNVAFETAADSVATTSIEDPGLEPDSVHCYRVRAFNPQYESEWSEIACGIVAPDPVTSLSATPDPADQTSQVIVTWQPGASVPATSFRVSYREAGQDSFSDPIVASSGEATISGLSDATVYEIAVQARRVIDESASQSSTVTTTVQTYLSFWPGDVNGDGTVSAEDVVSLTAPACFGAATGFSTSGQSVAWAEIAVDVGSQDPSVLRCDADRSGSVNVFDFLAIAANAGRTTGKGTGPVNSAIVNDAQLARIISIFESFQPAEGNARQKQLKDDLGRILHKRASDLPDEVALGEVYPNPASQRFSAAIDLPESASVSTILVNAAGQIVKREANGDLPAGHRTLEIDVSGLAPGLYFVVVETSGRRLTTSITVIR